MKGNLNLNSIHEILHLVDIPFIARNLSITFCGELLTISMSGVDSDYRNVRTCEP